MDPKVELGFGSTWQTDLDAVSWTDVTCYVMDRRQPLKVQRGASAAFGQVDPGKLDLVLKNADRRFDPLHAQPTWLATSAADGGVSASITETVNGVVDVRVDCAPSSLPGSVGVLAANGTSDLSDVYWSFEVLSDGKLRVQWSTTGGGSYTGSYTSTVPVPGYADATPDFSRRRLRVVLGVSSPVWFATFYTAPVGEDEWSILGAIGASGGTFTPLGTQGPVYSIGAACDGTSGFPGKVYAAEIRDGQGGRIMASPVFHTPGTAFPVVDDQSNSWTAQDTATIATDPDAPASPYYGQLVPGVPVRVSCDVNATTVPVFTGYVVAWPQRYDRADTMATVPVVAFDGFDKLARATPRPTIVEDEILADNPWAYWPLADSTGTVMTDVSGNERHGTWTTDVAELATVQALPTGPRVAGVRFDGDNVGWLAEWLESEPASMVALIMPSSTQTAAVVQSSEAGINPDGKLLGVGEDDATDRMAVLAIARNNDAAISKLTQVRAGDAAVIGYRATTSPALPMVMKDGVGGYALQSASVSLDVRGEREAGTSVGGGYGGRRGFGTDYGATGFSGFVAHVAIFDQFLSASRFLAYTAAMLYPLDGQSTDERLDWLLDEIGWHANNRTIATGHATLGPLNLDPAENALSYLRSIEASEAGRIYITASGLVAFRDRYWQFTATEATEPQVTFTDDQTGTTYADIQIDLDDELVVNIANYQRRDGGTITATDDTSVAAHGELADAKGDLLVQTDAQVRDLAEWTVYTRGTPTPRVPSIRVPLHAYDPADQQAVLELDLGYRVSVERTPQGVGDAVELAATVDGISHEIAFNEWWVELFVSPATRVGEDHLWQWDVSSWDQSTRWAI